MGAKASVPVPAVPVAGFEEYAALALMATLPLGALLYMTTGADKNKKIGFYASYQQMLVHYPLVMNMIQSGLIGAAGGVTSQVLLEGGVTSTSRIAELVFLNAALIAPIVSMWIPLLGSMNLHWTLATAVDRKKSQTHPCSLP